MATPPYDIYSGFPKLAVFEDWYAHNPKNDLAYGLLGCTFSQALCWVVNHMDLSLEWEVTAAKELR
jgi:hypothetical protein